MNDGAGNASDEYFKNIVGKMRLDWAMIQPSPCRNCNTGAEAEGLRFPAPTVYAGNASPLNRKWDFKKRHLMDWGRKNSVSHL